MARPLEQVLTWQTLLSNFPEFWRRECSEELAPGNPKKTDIPIMPSKKVMKIRRQEINNGGIKEKIINNKS